MTDEVDAPDRLDDALEKYKEMGSWLWVTLYLSEQAKALLRSGDPEHAKMVVQRAFREREATGEYWAEAELHRIVGEICVALGDPEGAQTAFGEAVLAAESQNARSLAKRAIKSRDLSTSEF